MHIDTGLVIVVIAVLIFYLRLIIIQRERVRRALQPSPASSKKKKNSTSRAPAPRFSIVSQNKRDWLIAGIGVVLIFIGVLLNRQMIHIALAQGYWWLPVSIGIVMFSWLFR